MRKIPNLFYSVFSYSTSEDQEKTKILSVVTGATALFAFFWMAGALKVEALLHYRHDDGLFLRTAAHILNFEWLGPFDNLTLVKGPGYSLFIAFCYFFGLPTLLAQNILYALACVIVCRAIRPIVPQRLPAMVVFCLLLFNPINFSLSRITRNYFYTSLCLLAIACMIGAVLRVTKDNRRINWWTASAGSSIGMALITREEGVWLAPSLGLLLATTFFLFQRQTGTVAAVYKSIRVLTLPIALIALIPGSVAALNYYYYGRFIVTDIYGGEASKACGAMMRVVDPGHGPDLYVTRSMREKLYAISPAFAELRSYFETAENRYTCRAALNNYTPICQRIDQDEIPGGWFIWALRDAIAAAGHYSSPSEARSFYQQIHLEILRACEANQLACLPPGAGLAPPWRNEYLKPLGKSFFRAGAYILRFKGESMSSLRSRFSLSSGSEINDQKLLVLKDEYLPILTEKNTSFSISGWICSSVAPVTLSVVRAGRIPYPSTIEERLPSPDVSLELQKSKRDFPFADHARFRLKTSCMENCQLIVQGPDRILATFPLKHNLRDLVADSIIGHIDEAQIDFSFVDPVWRKSDIIKLNLGDRIHKIYKTIFFPAGIISVLALLTHVVFLLVYRNLDLFCVVQIIFLITIASRLTVIAAVDFLSFPALDGEYLAPAHPFLIVFSCLGVVWIGRLLESHLLAGNRSSKMKA